MLESWPLDRASRAEKSLESIGIKFLREANRHAFAAARDPRAIEQREHAKSSRSSVRSHVRILSVMSSTVQLGPVVG
jgi:hypothetical protein